MTITMMTSGVTQTASGALEYAERQPSWQVAGTQGQTDDSVWDVAAEAGLLDWNLRKEPLTAWVPNDGMIPVPNQFVNVRNSPDGPASVGIVGSRYHNLPNETWIAFVEQVLDSGTGMYVDAMGTLRGGSQVFAVLGMQEAILDLGGDLTAMYLLVVSSHDGSTPLTLIPRPTRLMCTNQVRGLLGKRSLVSYRVRHLSGAGDLSGKVTAAQEALGVTSRYMAEFQAEAEAMINQTVTDQQFKEIIAHVFPETQIIGKPDTKPGRALTMAEGRVEGVWGMWKGDRVAGTPVEGTALGALHAIGEYVDWGSTVKGSGTMGTQAARAERDLVNAATVEATKVKAYNVVKALV